MVMQTQTPEQAREQAERTAKAVEEARKAGAKQVEAAEKFSEQASMETLKRMESMRPTPTQHECNLAAVGALDPAAPKEDDGSGPELVHARVVVPRTELDERGNYQTRAMQSGQPSQPRPATPPPPKQG